MNYRGDLYALNRRTFASLTSISLSVVSLLASCPTPSSSASKDRLINIAVPSEKVNLHHQFAYNMSDPANLLTHATALVEHAQALQETSKKLEELAEALRTESAAWTEERAKAAEIQARLTAQLAQATRGISVDINVGFRAGHGAPHPRASVNARVGYPGSDAGLGTNRVEDVTDE